MKRSLPSSRARGKRVLVDEDDTKDLLSKLPKEILVNIISRLCTSQAMRTSILSKQWIDLWKDKSSLFFNLQYLVKECDLTDVSKVVNDHCGYLVRCTIYCYTYQCVKETDKALIQKLIHVKKTKHLTLINSFSLFKGSVKTITLDLPLETFSNTNLISLNLGKYVFINQHAFQNCGNLKNLTLICVFPDIEVFNLVLVSCPNLEVLSVDITVDKKSGLLKIDNHKLKFLYLSCDKIDRIEVSSPNIDILSIGDLSCTKENFVVADPRHKFNRDYWTTGRSYTNYNISCPDQEEENIAHKFMIGHYDLYMCQYGSMSVRVDLKNTKEVKMLQEILAEWPGEFRELEIVIKNNNAPEREDNKFWEEKKPFLDACFKAHIIRMFNFSGSKVEFALASYFIRQRTVIKTLMIKVSSNFASNKMDLERTMTKLVEFSDGDPKLDIMVV